MKSATRISWTALAVASDTRCAAHLRTCLSTTAALVLAISVAACSPSSATNPHGGSGAPAQGSSGTGVAGGMAGAAAPSVPFSTVLTLFQGKNCGICHNTPPSAVNGGLQFNPADKAAAHAALVGKMSTGLNGSMCSGKTYVVAGQPAMSLIYQKLTATPPCGMRMPSGSPALTDSELQTVSGWIMAGAKND